MNKSPTTPFFSITMTFLLISKSKVTAILKKKELKKMLSKKQLDKSLRTLDPKMQDYLSESVNMIYLLILNSNQMNHGTLNSLDYFNWMNKSAIKLYLNPKKNNYNSVVLFLKESFYLTAKTSNFLKSPMNLILSAEYTNWRLIRLLHN